jgi:hypothetical protein
LPKLVVALAVLDRTRARSYVAEERAIDGDNSGALHYRVSFPVIYAGKDTR